MRDRSIPANTVVLPVLIGEACDCYLHLTTSGCQCLAIGGWEERLVVIFYSHTAPPLFPPIPSFARFSPDDRIQTESRTPTFKNTQENEWWIPEKNKEV